MADNLPKTIKCGERATGLAEVTSPRSPEEKWTEEVGYGPAYRRASENLNQYDADCKDKVIKKLNDWIESVKCVESQHCKECKPFRPNHVHVEDVIPEDKPALQTGRILKMGTISLERIYIVKCDAVVCRCPGEIVIG